MEATIVNYFITKILIRSDNKSKGKYNG